MGQSEAGGSLQKASRRRTLTRGRYYHDYGGVGKHLAIRDLWGQAAGAGEEEYWLGTYWVLGIGPSYQNLWGIDL